MKLQILAIENRDWPLDENVVAYCKQHDLPLYSLDLGRNALTDRGKVLEIRNFLDVTRFDKDDLLLIIDGHSTVLTGDPKDFIANFEKLGLDVAFAADSYYSYPETALQYYYWKYYPRYAKYYNYLNSGMFVGKVDDVKALINDVYAGYHFNSVNINPDDPYFTRFYVDSVLDVFSPSYKIGIDSEQSLLAANGGNLSVRKWPYMNWVQNHSFQLLEKEKLQAAELEQHQTKLRYLSYDKGKQQFKSTLTGKKPQFVHFPADNFDQVQVLGSEAPDGSSKATWLSFFAFIHSVWRALLVLVINRFSIDPKQTFRFEKHKNPDYEHVMQQFLGFLDSNEAFTFAHFNDGELNFIRKFLNNDHKKTWNGRIQDQYDVPLAERLVDSIKYKQKNYFLGVSCSTCAAPRRALADDLIGDYEHKIGAMVFHHNLRYLPQLIKHMQNREMYFVANDFQNLDILKNLGVTVKEENIIRIPFVNSHKVYDTLEGKKFPDGAFVMLMCGMLAKILIRNWYELNPKTTFVAFGSTLDDFIQTSNTNYRPYPRKLPLTRNIHLIKAFLFGNKKKCVECYNI